MAKTTSPKMTPPASMPAAPDMTQHRQMHDAKGAVTEAQAAQMAADHHAKTHPGTG